MFYLSNIKKLMTVLLALVAIKVYAGDVEYYDGNAYCEGLNTSIEYYACLTEHAAKGIALISNLTSDELTALKAVEAMNLVQNIASSARYSYLLATQNFFTAPPSGLLLNQEKFEPPTLDNQDICLKHAFGICGNHQFLFIALLKAIGISARPIDFFYSMHGVRQNHAAAEVKIGENWAYFDISWGSFWLKDRNKLFEPASLEEILAGKGFQMTGNNSWYLNNVYQRSFSEVFSYLKVADRQILINKGGTFVLSFKDKAIDFTSHPNYFGKPLGYDELKLRLPKNTPQSKARLDIAALGGSCKRSWLVVGSQRFPLSPKSFLIDIAANTLLQIEGQDEVCYAIIKSLVRLSDPMAIASTRRRR